MPLSSEAQALFDHAKQSLPRWLTGAASAALEWLYGETEIMDEVRVQGQEWLDITLLENAVGVELDQHAKDRGTSRRVDESDITLRERLRNITDALTEPALQTGVDAILDSQGFLAILKAGTISITGWNTIFKSKFVLSGGGFQTNLYLSMVSNATNPPTMTETISLDGKTCNVTINYSAGVTTRAAVESLVTASGTKIAVLTASSSGATTLAAGDAFANKRFYLSGLVGLRRDRGHFHTNGSCRSFLSRGYRMCNNDRPMGYIFILPYLSTAATASAVAEYLRQTGSAGYIYYVERRLNP